MKKLILFIIIATSANIYSQNWLPVKDIATQISFLMPENFQKFDTLSTRMYGSTISEKEAVQVHIFEKAIPDFSDDILATALSLENGDTLLAIARLMALVSDSEISSLTELYENGNRGIELELNYLTQSNDIPYSTVIRYFFINDNFIAFTWTGEVDYNVYLLGIMPMEQFKNRNAFFQSITIP